MRELKKLTCSANLCNIIGKPYEQNIVDLILMTCEDAEELNLSNIEYTFYYNGKTTEQEVRHFMRHFNKYKNVKAQQLRDFDAKGVWFSILTNEEYKSTFKGRSYFIIKTVSEQSLTTAILDFYNKAKLQIQISKNGKR